MTLPDFYVFEINQNTFQYFIDVLIAPSLFAYYWSNTKGKNINLILAFNFLWAGDLLILFEQSVAYLKWGVFCYWVMQLFLIRNFFNYFRGYSFREHLLGILFYGAYLAVFLNHVYGALGDMRIHGVVYGFTLSFFGSFMIMELLKDYSKAKAYMTVGLFLFSIRDVLLTYNKRYFEEEFFTFPIPIFHAVGFFMLLKSFMLLENQNIKAIK